MSHTPVNAPAQKDVSKIDLLRQELTQADTKRRALLVALFFQYQGETGQIIETLFAGASRATLEKVEALLSEGAKS